MRFAQLCIPLLCMACESDKGIKKFNNPPTATVTSHGDGDDVLEGYEQTFIGTVGDLNHDFNELTVVWSTDQRELCSPQQPDEMGTSFCMMPLMEGESQIKLQVSRILHRKVKRLRSTPQQTGPCIGSYLAAVYRRATSSAPR